MILTQSAPSLLPLIQRLRQLFSAQRREVLMRLPGAVRSGSGIDLTHWNDVFFQALRPAMLPYWQAGLIRGRQQVDGAALKSSRRSVRKDTNYLRVHDRSFNLHNPAVIDAIDQATMDFCRTTNATATRDLDEAIQMLRGELSEGIAAGESYLDLSKRVQSLFADPVRANMIATTESVRALNHGSLLMYERSGAATGSVWVTTSDPCPRCLELDGEEREFGEPFVVLGKGPAAYRTVMAPPLHVFCLCVLSPLT